MNEYTTAPGHRLELIGRERLIVSGVEDVERFDETGIVMSTAAGVLVVTGGELHIGKLSLDGGELNVDGRIDSVAYEEPSRERAACCGGCLDKPDGKHNFHTVAAIRSSHFAGAVLRIAVRCAACAPSETPPCHRGAGHPILPQRGDGGVSFHAASGGGTTAAVRTAGSAGWLGAVFWAAVRLPAAGVELLGGYAGVFIASGLHPSALGKENVHQNVDMGKKPLLFCPEMRYNQI